MMQAEFTVTKLMNSVHVSNFHFQMKVRVTTDWTTWMEKLITGVF